MQIPVPGKPWQVRQTQLEIDLERLRRNCQRLLLRAKPAQLLVLLKSDAYGHSHREVASSLEKLKPSSGLHGFGVANVEEGIELRREGVRRPVYIMSGIQRYDADLDRCLSTCDLTPVISSLSVLKEAADTLAKRKIQRSFHLKFNTGMNRLGLEIDELAQCLSILKKSPNLKITGIMSHLSTAELPNSNLTKHQAKEFEKIVKAFQAQNFSLEFEHLCNSFGLKNKIYPTANLARVGLHLYGIDDNELEPVARWTAQIYQIRHLSKGQSVGYGARFKAKRKMTMAVLGVGYGDGYRRAFSNQAEVLVRGRRCPVIGSVSMDLTAIDVTSVSDTSTNDRATLLGLDGKDEITAAELAKHAKTISYEILTGISPRVPRVFV